MYIVYTRKGEELCVLKEVEYVGKYMSERVVNSTLFSDIPIQFEVGDYIEYRGEKYVLNITPTAKKTGKSMYTYTLSFLHESYELYFCMFRDYVPSDNEVIYANHRQVDFTGDVTYLTERIQYNLNKVYPNKWTIDVNPDIDKSLVKNISAQSLNCWNALSLVNTEFEQPFYIKDYTIYVGYDEPIVDGVFLYGKGGGAYDIERISSPNDDIVTKLSVTGTSRNLDYTYPKQPEWKDSNLPKTFILQPLTLMLPEFKKDGKTDFLLASDELIAKYGIRESSIVVDDIYPSISGATNNDGNPIDEIVSVKPIDDKSPYFEITMNNPDFVDHDGNKAVLTELMIPNKSKVVMKSGSLQGFEFMIVQAHEEGRFVRLILQRNDKEGKNANTDEDFIVPNEDINVKVGDKFVFIDIYMPQSYIREAEIRLEDRGRKILDSMMMPNYTYNITVDHIFMEENGYYDKIYEGQKLHLQDEGLEANTAITINTLTIKEGHSLIPEYKISLNDEVKATTKEVLKNQMSKVEAYLNDLKEEEVRRIIVLTSWDGREPSEYNVLSSVRTLGAIRKAIEALSEQIDKQYLRKDRKDTAQELITFLNGINVTNRVTSDEVRSDSVEVKDRLSTPDFVSGYLGLGFRIFRDELDKLYKGEMDELTIRGIFRVYEFVISQLRAENGTIVTSDAMRVKSIDTTANKIYLDTDNGVLYNPFEEGDILEVQQFDGYDKKQYELTVTLAVIGSLDDGENRVDYITYEEFEGDINKVKERDILTRVDSVRDASRKGILKQSAIEPGSPYFDVIYGAKTSSKALKARLGRLDGIVDEYLGQLEGFGLYGSNVYLTGDFALRNGDNIGTVLEATKDSIQGVVKDIDDINKTISEAGWLTTAEGNKLWAKKELENGEELISIINQTPEEIKIQAKNISINGVASFNDNVIIGLDGTLKAKNGVFSGEIEATSGDIGGFIIEEDELRSQNSSTLTLNGKNGSIQAYSGIIGGFEIGQDRIGSSSYVWDSETGEWRPAEPGEQTEEQPFGNLAIYKDFFKVGGDNGYVMFGDDVIPASAGGAFSAAGRIVNNRDNSGDPFIDNANYGLFIDVQGGDRNYGLSSNAALLAPCFIGTATQFINFRGTGYSLNFSQANVFLSNSAQGATVALPNKSQVARMFGMRELPSSGFGFTFTVVGVARSSQVTFLDILNNDGVLKNYEISGGDVMKVLCYTLSGNMYYQVLHYRT